MTCQPPAIRDFFDLSHALQTTKLDFADDTLVEILQQKLAVPGNLTVDVTDEKHRELRFQLEAQLKPVLRAEDYLAFNLDSAFALVKSVAGKLQIQP